MSQINEFNRVVKHFLKNDVSISHLISQYETIELKPRRYYFRALVHSIIGQQLSVHSAKAIIRKFENHYGKTINPQLIIGEDTEILRSLGLSGAKVIYIKDLSEKLFSGKLSLKGIKNKGEEDIMRELTLVKGIGPWTVHMFMIFVLGKANILPEGDLGIKKAIMLNYNLKNLPTSEKVVEISKKNNWSPYNSYASLYLWRSIDGM